MLKTNKTVYLIGFLYSSIATGIYFTYFFRKDMSAMLIFAVTLILFLPVLLSLIRANIRLLQLNRFSILGFFAGFIFSAFLANNNIWPIALALWLVLSLPGILILNLICYLIRKKYT